MNRRAILINGVATTALLSMAPFVAHAAPLREWMRAEFHAKRKFADLAVGKIAYVERGKGPAAIFLHGFPLNGFQWRGVMARLDDVRRCIAPDLMGLGYSDVPASTDLSPVAQAEMIVAFMDRLGVREADFVANDSSDGIAQLIAAAHPDRVRSILFTNGDTHTNSPPEKLLPFIEMAKRGEVDAWYEKHLTDPSFVANGIGNAFSNPVPPELLEVYFRPLISSPKRRQQGQTFGTAMLPNPLPAIEPKLRAFKKPVRMVWARNSDLFADEWAEWLDRTFPGSTGIRFVDDAKLFFPEEQPALIVAECRKLWKA
ncbi:alpha/beta fold hydrolase [Roseiterribacter gracilis]|uniref:Hydrolase n=1 Tax=Roseiterribacter gracilis TaxID=2812848 RepID=A0A8S8XIP9_9PROT|nr:hydrolase [Rhodospirillales bacterium TMPK1]